MYMSLENTTNSNNSDSREIIYPNYKYCVWLLPEDKYWYKINKTITPHMSIKTHMELSDAINSHAALQKEINHKCINVLVDNNFLITNDEGFVSLEYKLYYSENNTKPKPKWWPNDPHMSLLYKYNENVNESEKKYMNKYVKNNNARFGTPCVVLCKGHHRGWEFVK